MMYVTVNKIDHCCFVCFSDDMMKMTVYGVLLDVLRIWYFYSLS